MLKIPEEFCDNQPLKPAPRDLGHRAGARVDVSPAATHSRRAPLATEAPSDPLEERARQFADQYIAADIHDEDDPRIVLREAECLPEAAGKVSEAWLRQNARKTPIAREPLVSGQCEPKSVDRRWISLGGQWHPQASRARSMKDDPASDEWRTWRVRPDGTPWRSLPDDDELEWLMIANRGLGTGENLSEHEVETAIVADFEAEDEFHHVDYVAEHTRGELLAEYAALTLLCEYLSLWNPVPTKRILAEAIATTAAKLGVTPEHVGDSPLARLLRSHAVDVRRFAALLWKAGSLPSQRFVADAFDVGPQTIRNDARVNLEPQVQAAIDNIVHKEQRMLTLVPNDSQVGSDISRIEQMSRELAGIAENLRLRHPDQPGTSVPIDNADRQLRAVEG